MAGSLWVIMSEYTLQFISFLKVLWVAIFSLFYGLGGISKKWLRRYVGPFWIGLGIFLLGYFTQSFRWWYLFYPLLLCISLHIGYGAEVFIDKLRKRFIYGLALGVSAIPLLYHNPIYHLFGFHIGCCIVVSVIFGVFNISKSARSEEAIIGFMSTVMPMFLI